MVSTTDEAADLIIKGLKDKYKNRIVIHYYKSYTSNSIYLKLDYGACNSVRISDHKKPDNQYHYKYELRIDKRKDYFKLENNIYTMSFAGKNIDNLIEKIISDRDKRIRVKGKKIYNKDITKRKKYMHGKAKKFYKDCVEVKSYEKVNN